MPPNTQPPVPAPNPIPSPPSSAVPQNPVPPAPAPQPVPPPVAPQPVPGSGPVPQPPVPPQPVMPPGQPIPPLQPPIASPAKKKTWLWITLGVVGFVLLIVIIATVAVVGKKPKQYSGNYTRFGTYKPDKPPAAGNFSFKYPVNMVQVQNDPDTVIFRQNAKPGQALKTKDGWESSVTFTASTCDCYSFLASDSNKDITDYFGQINKKALEKDNATDVQTQTREDLSSKDQGGKLVFDFQYKNKDGITIKGRRISYINKKALESLGIYAIDKVWDENTPAWDAMTNNFEVQLNN